MGDSEKAFSNAGRKLARCHAMKCRERVESTAFMCPRHWALVPEELRAAIERSNNIKIDKKISKNASEWVAKAEGFALSNRTAKIAKVARVMSDSDQTNRDGG